MPEIAGVGGIFIDDIVLPSGQTFMGQVGGGVTHALMGAALWDTKPGIVAVYGQGLPDEAFALLETHLDTTGLISLDIPQMRAWQLFEEDGSRRELYRVKEIEPFITGAKVEHLPEAYRSCGGFYLLQGIDSVQLWLQDLPDTLVCWEPLQQVMLAENGTAFRDVLRTYSVGVVSPNLEEACAVYGELSPESLVDAMLSDGAGCTALRMGRGGSLLRRQQDENAVYIPAVDVDCVVDQTGAGNTYCGALLLGLVRGRTLVEAGCMGSVAASFCLETQGVLDPANIDIQERNKRFESLLEKVRL